MVASTTTARLAAIIAGRSTSGQPKPAAPTTSKWIVTSTSPLLARPASGGEEVGVEGTNASRAAKVGDVLLVETSGMCRRVAVQLVTPKAIAKAYPGETAAALGGVTKVAGKAPASDGSLTLTASDVGALPAGTRLVTSVEGRTGAVSIEGMAANRITIERLTADQITPYTGSKVQINGALTATRLPYVTAAANMYCDAWGNFAVSSSARRLKVNIKPLEDEVDPYRVLDVPARIWSDRETVKARRSVTNGADPRDVIGVPLDTRTPGVVAEEVEAAGLHQFVTYDPDGTASGVAYDRLAVLLIPIVRDQQHRIDALEQRLAALESNGGKPDRQVHLTEEGEPHGH